MALVAAPAVTLTYVGVPNNTLSGNASPGGGQLIADQTSGPKSRTLVGYGVATNGNTTTGANSAPVYFIDGVQTFGKTIVLPINSVQIDTSRFTNGADYYTVGAAGQIKVGDSVTIAGFTNSGNNLTTTVAAVTSSYITVTNSGAVTETNPAATMTDLQAAVPITVDAFISGNAADTAGDLAVASAAFFPSGLTGTGFTLNWAALSYHGSDNPLRSYHLVL